MSRRSSRKYRICTDSIAHTAGTTKRSTWSPAAKSRYDRCLRKVENNKYTNEQSPTKPTGPVGSPTANLASAKFSRDLSRQTTLTQRRTYRQEKAPTVIGGKKVGMEASHTVYDRIGALISERRSGDTEKRQRVGDRRKASILRQMYQGGKVATFGKAHLQIQGLVPIGSGEPRKSSTEQHREKSPE